MKEAHSVSTWNVLRVTAIYIMNDCTHVEAHNTTQGYSRLIQVNKWNLSTMFIINVVQKKIKAPNEIVTLMMWIQIRKSGVDVLGRNHSRQGLNHQPWIIYFDYKKTYSTLKKPNNIDLNICIKCCCSSSLVSLHYVICILSATKISMVKKSGNRYHIKKRRYTMMLENAVRSEVWLQYLALTPSWQLY